MKTKGKYIGLNQRIPFDVLDFAINMYIEQGVIDRELILNRIKETTTGENRARKATAYVAQILSRQKRLLDLLEKQLNGSSYTTWRTEDRKTLVLCLISLTYPIMYDLLVAMSQGFKVQQQINKKFICEKLMSIYGSNRTVDIAIDALLPMIIELKTTNRDKISIYSKAPKLAVNNLFAYEVVIYTDIKLSGSKSILYSEIKHRPWYDYFDFSPLYSAPTSILILKKDSSIGEGYLTINESRSTPAVTN